MKRPIGSAALFLLLGTACASAPSPSPSDAPGQPPAGSEVVERATARSQLAELTRAVGEYEMKNGHCPASTDEIANPMPNDPWGQPIAYMPASPENPSNAFVSAGPDGELLTADDIVARVECSR